MCMYILLCYICHIKHIIAPNISLQETIHALQNLTKKSVATKIYCHKLGLNLLHLYILSLERKIFSKIDLKMIRQDGLVYVLMVIRLAHEVDNRLQNKAKEEKSTK